MSYHLMLVDTDLVGDFALFRDGPLYFLRGGGGVAITKKKKNFPHSRSKEKNYAQWAKGKNRGSLSTRRILLD